MLQGLGFIGVGLMDVVGFMIFNQPKWKYGKDAPIVYQITQFDVTLKYWAGLVIGFILIIFGTIVLFL